MLVGEIDTETFRISLRKSKIEKELEKLASKINAYTKWAWTFVIIGLVISIFGIVYFIFTNEDTGFGLDKLGDFMSGSVTAIWSLSGLFFIYIAFLGQKQQLLNQQLEIMYSQLDLKQTRLALIDQKEEMALQNSTLKLQKFENTFFQMLTLFSSIVNSLDLRSGPNVISQGRDCFKSFNQRLREHVTEKLQFQQKDYRSSDIGNALLGYTDFYKINKSDLCHYFTTLYHIIKFVDHSDIDDKKQYIAIVRAQLSSYEQIFLFYNCLHKNGKDKFKPLIEKYGIFKNIDESLILNREHLKEYAQSAFGK